MYPDLLYQIALTLIPQIGDIRAKALIERYGSAEAVLKAPKHQLEKIEGIGTLAAKEIKHFCDYKLCEDEIRFMEDNDIKPLFIIDPSYPQKLLHCCDSPTLLYFKGKADLNASKIISVVGTRNNTDYGKMLCEKMITDLAGENILVVSGLAFGIDTIAHKAAVKNKMKTVGVMAHGHDRIYPSQNKILAREMTAHGGLLTDFMSGANPDRQNFPKRNRIVAGICDALIVIESSARGGSLITAELANSYNRDVFAFPGRTTDSRSEGCNFLIKNNKAMLISSADDLLEIMNWKEAPKKIKRQRELFIELTHEEKIVVDILATDESVGIDKLYLKSGLSSSSVANALLMLEMQGLITALPGKIFKLT